jgi:hypothetical protein
MSGCGFPCKREELSLCPANSPGPVQDDELICRGFEYPKDFFSKDKKPKQASISNSELAKGELSVWRTGNLTKLTTADVTNHLRGSALPNVGEICGVLARQIREMNLSGRRVISVLDDCKTDNVGGIHPGHATLAICADVRTTDPLAEDTGFQIIKASLFLLFKNNSLWKSEDLLKAQATAS